MHPRSTGNSSGNYVALPYELLNAFPDLHLLTVIVVSSTTSTACKCIAKYLESGLGFGSRHLTSDQMFLTAGAYLLLR